MNVRLIVPYYPPNIGGLETQAHLLMRRLAGRGHRVSVFTLTRRPGPPMHEVLDGVAVFRLPVGVQRRGRGLAWWGFVTLAAAAPLAGMPDAVLVFMPDRAVIPVRIASVLRGAPWIVRFASFGSHPECDTETTRLQRTRLGRVALRAVARATEIVATTHAMEHWLRATEFPDTRITVIPNAVEFPPPMPARSDDAFEIWYLGALRPHKGPALLLDAWELVCARSPTLVDGLRLRIIGGGPQREELIGRVARSQTMRNVRIEGYVPSPWTSQARPDALVLPSHIEGMSNTLLEAMSRGVPVIASDIPSNRELLEGGSLGRLFSVGDPASLASAIEGLSNRPELDARARRARAAIVDRCAPDVVIDAWEALLARVAR